MVKGTILFVEPDDNIRNMLRAYFVGQGYEVMTCTDYDNALEETRNQLPAVVVAEIDLPNKSGWDLIRTIRETKRTSHIPIIAISQSSKQLIQEYEDAIIDDFVAKPFDIEELKLRIQNVVPEPRRQINPISGFPTGNWIEAHLRVLMKKQADWVFLDIKIANFEAFKAVYSWQRGDEMIKSMALIITDALELHGTQNDFVGHVKSDHFIIISHSSDWKMFLDTLKLRIGSLLDNQYNEIERGQGYVLINERKNPLMQLIYGVFIAAEQPRDIDIRELVRIATEDRQQRFGDEPKLDDGIVTEW